MAVRKHFTGGRFSTCFPFNEKEWLEVVRESKKDVATSQSSESLACKIQEGD